MIGSVLPFHTTLHAIQSKFRYRYANGPAVPILTTGEEWNNPTMTTLGTFLAPVTYRFITGICLL